MPAPVSPLHRQAASRYSARAKRPTTAWLLWILGPFMLHVPVHDFYLGAIGRGLLKLLLAGSAWAGFVIAYVALAVAVDDEYGSGVLGPVFWIALALTVTTGLAAFIWWVVDGITMNRRLERLDAGLREELSREHGVDPWSF